MKNLNQAYYTILAAALIRGKLGGSFKEDKRFTTDLYELSSIQLNEIISIGKENNINLHKFKITTELARVQKVLGILRGLQPVNMLDIGSGKGTFLWPLVIEIQNLKIDCIDILSDRIKEIDYVSKGGINNLSAQVMDATQLQFSNNSFDIVTALEVLEHIPDYKKAISEIVRVTKRFVIISVPSKSDENPEHLRLFDKKIIESDFRKSGVTSIKFDQVLNHFIVIVRK